MSNPTVAPNIPPQAPPPVYVPPPRRSFAGPIVLIVIGVLFLLGNMHYITWRTLGHWFARYWPVLIIIWGVVKLIEYYQAKREGVRAAGIGVGGFFLLFFLIVLGLAATSMDRFNWDAVRSEIDMDDDLSSFFGQTYSYNAQLPVQDFKAGDTLRIISDRGAVTIKTGDEPKIRIEVAKRVVADDQNQANQIDQGTPPLITTEGSIITVNANTNGAGNKPVESTLTITIPKAAPVDVATRRGDVTVDGRTGWVKVDVSRGDVMVANVDGSVNVSIRKGSLRASKITGDLALDGRIDDTTLSDITGTVRLTGEYFGDMNISKVGKGVTFQSSKTDMQVGKLDGDLMMETGNLHVTNANGVQVTTKSKDITLENVSGDLKVVNKNGTVTVAPAKFTLLTVDNQRGSVELRLAAKQAFQYNLRTVHGDITSDFGDIKVTGQKWESVSSGVIGTGGPKIDVSNDNGSIEIRKTI